MKLSAKILGAVVATGILLFGTAGTFAWWNAWLFLVVVLVLGVLTAQAVGLSPGLAEERRTAARKAPPWDRAAVVLVNLAMPVMVILAGLAQRVRAMRAIPAGASALAFVMLVPSALLTYRALAVNPFFSSHVRIQIERGHVVVAAGPYRYLRHPGYAGSIAFNLLAPVALGSWLALIPGAAAAVLLVWRTGREDRILLRDLPGYAQYATRVPYRLVPGVW